MKKEISPSKLFEKAIDEFLINNNLFKNHIEIDIFIKLQIIKNNKNKIMKKFCT